MKWYTKIKLTFDGTHLVILHDCHFNVSVLTFNFRVHFSINRAEMFLVLTVRKFYYGFNCVQQTAHNNITLCTFWCIFICAQQVEHKCIALCIFGASVYIHYIVVTPIIYLWLLLTLTVFGRRFLVGI